MAGWPIYVDGKLVGEGVYRPNRFKYMYDSETGALRFVSEIGELVKGMEEIQLEPGLTGEEVSKQLTKS